MMQVKQKKSLIWHAAVLMIAAVLPSLGFCAEPEQPAPTGPACFGSIVFESPSDTTVMSYASGMGFSGGLYVRAAISQIGDKILLADIYYGSPDDVPSGLENAPSTKIDLGSVIASVECITKKDRLKTCRVSLMPSGKSAEPLVFFYHDLPEPDSALADKMWRSAHTDDRCREKTQ